MYTIKVWTKNDLNHDWSYKIDRSDLSLVKTINRVFFLLKWKKKIEIEYISP